MIKRACSLFAVVILFVAQAAFAGDDEALLAAENAMMDAFSKADKAALSALIDDSFVLTSATSRGELIDKRGYIEGGLRLVKVESFKFHDVRVRRFGDVAVVNCRIDWRSTWGGKRWDADFLMTDVWVWRGEQWRIVSRHSSYPAPAAPAGTGE